MSDEIRRQLSKPFGPLMGFDEALPAISRRRGALIAVGDQTILNLLAQGIRPDIGVYDGATRRKPIPQGSLDKIEGAAHAGPLTYAKNPAGSISMDMEAKVIQALAAGKGWVRIEGEDDLASLVAMAGAWEGSLLLYGQPGEGVVVVEIDGKMKKKAKELLKKIKD
ncbi:MAG: DUF359 domain-containing protein [Candidatus Micrarchaeota archaeon]